VESKLVRVCTLSELTTLGTDDLLSITLACCYFYSTSSAAVVEKVDFWSEFLRVKGNSFVCVNAYFKNVTKEVRALRQIEVNP